MIPTRVGIITRIRMQRPRGRHMYGCDGHVPVTSPAVRAKSAPRGADLKNQSACSDPRAKSALRNADLNGNPSSNVAPPTPGQRESLARFAIRVAPQSPWHELKMQKVSAKKASRARTGRGSLDRVSRRRISKWQRGIPDPTKRHRTASSTSGI
jgi:hypothetical protein